MEWELELQGAHLVAIALATVAGAVLLLYFFGGKHQPRGAAPAATPADAAELHAAMVRLQAELPELLRDVNGRLDAKMRALRVLVSEASGAIDELRRLRTSTVPASATAAPTDCRDTSLESVAVPDSTLADGHSAPASVAARAKIVEHHAPADSGCADSADPRTQRYAHVYSLADDGLEPGQISAETGMQRGEVELVLKLRRKKIRLDRGGRLEPAHVSSAIEEATV